MTQQNKKLDEDIKVSSDKALKKSDNLHQIQESNKENQVLEINNQMTGLENSIEKLNLNLNKTNKTIKADVKRLTQSDADISEKVAETYRQLGQIDATFQQLGKQSKKLTTDIKSINNNIKSFEKASSEALNNAIESQSSVNTEFRHQHEEIISRAEKLSKKTDSITRKLNKSIKDNSLALTELEAQIIAELEKQAQLSEQRDNHLDSKIITIDEELFSQKARMLLMQSVDEALDKRAATLEKTAESLISDSDDLKQSTEVLNILTAKLSDDIEALEIHTAKLAVQNIEQQGFIEKLQSKTDSMARTLLALATLEKKHFKVLASSSLILLLAIVGLYFYGEYQRDTQLTDTALRSSQVNQQVANLQSRLEDEQLASQVFYSDITDLQKHIGELKKELDGVNNQVTTINDQVVEMNDQVESIDGRIQYFAPLNNFGTDNIIHGSEWISNLDSELYSVKVAQVTSKQELYETAARYNYYLKQNLAYFINQDGSYTLIHGGQYNSDELDSVLRDMPSFINYERVTIMSNAEILQQIQVI